LHCCSFSASSSLSDVALSDVALSDVALSDVAAIDHPLIVGNDTQGFDHLNGLGCAGMSFL